MEVDPGGSGRCERKRVNGEAEVKELSLRVNGCVRGSVDKVPLPWRATEPRPPLCVWVTPPI